MARIRVRFELNKGRVGAPLDKLGEIAIEAEKFLRMLAHDFSIEIQKGDLSAVDFKNGSVSFDVRFEGDVEANQAKNFNRGLDYVTQYLGGEVEHEPRVSDGTLLQYANIGYRLGPKDSVGVGLYDGGDKPDWRRITHQEAARVREEIETPILSDGAIQGVIHSLFKEGSPPHFRVRELATGDLVDCYYDEEMYQRVAAALKERSAVIHVTGHLSFDRATRTIKTLHVKDIETAKPLSDREFEGFFGSAPNITGDMTTDEFIENLRGEGE